MKIYFENKETSNKRRLKAFLAKSGYERIETFFRISRQNKLLFEQKNQDNKKGNFVLEKK